jgi:hypothetical protein
MRVERIATAPMTRQQREQAVTALAVLITAWQHGHAGQPHDDPAGPLPLPGPVSDTDPAPQRPRGHRQDAKAKL